MNGKVFNGFADHRFDTWIGSRVLLGRSTKLLPRKKWERIFKNESSETSGRQPLNNLIGFFLNT